MMPAVLRIFLAELRAIAGHRQVALVLLVAPFIYALFYPQPYIAEALRDVPISVVDLDGSVASRDLFSTTFSSIEGLMLKRYPLAEALVAEPLALDSSENPARNASWAKFFSWNWMAFSIPSVFALSFIWACILSRSSCEDFADRTARSSGSVMVYLDRMGMSFDCIPLSGSSPFATR